MLGNTPPKNSNYPNELLEIDLLGKVHKNYVLEKDYYGSYAETSNTYLILSKNMSTRGFMNKGKISIEDIDYYQKKVRITSPRSIASMNKLGVNDKDLEYLPFKDYLLKTPELIPQNKEMQRKIYNYVENIRRARIDQIKQLRNEIPEEEAISTKKRCFSSKFREQNTFLNNSINNKKLSSTFLEKDIKAFNRMRNINKTE